MRFFSYIWPGIKNNTRNRTVDTNGGIARETGDEVYRGNIHYHTCEDLYMKNPNCPKYKNREILVDLRDMFPTSYSPGERIIGNLENSDGLLL